MDAGVDLYIDGLWYGPGRVDVRVAVREDNGNPGGGLAGAILRPVHGGHQAEGGRRVGPATLELDPPDSLDNILEQRTQTALDLWDNESVNGGGGGVNAESLTLQYCRHYYRHPHQNPT